LARFRVGIEPRAMGPTNNKAPAFLRGAIL
jgi:hypothetical protein